MGEDLMWLLFPVIWKYVQTYLEKKKSHVGDSAFLLLVALKDKAIIIIIFLISHREQSNSKLILLTSLVFVATAWSTVTQSAKMPHFHFI